VAAAGSDDVTVRRYRDTGLVEDILARVTAPADLVLSGGRVFDGTRLLPDATAVAVRSGRVVAVGTDTEVRAAVGRAHEHEDLRGRLVAPGFTDAHVHPVMGGVERLGCDLTGATTAAETLERIRSYATARSQDPWVVGGGWLKEAFENGLPTAAALDEVVGNRPALLRDNSHHAVWVSTAALRLAGLDRVVPDPPDGTLSRLPDGRPAGTLHEAAMDLVVRHLPPTALAEQVAGLLDAQRYLHSLGVTGWQDAIVGSYAGHPDPTDAYLAVAASGRLTARVVGALWWPRGTAEADVDDVVAQLVATRQRVRDAVPDGRFRTTSVKVMQDGVVESRTAGLSTPYLDPCGHQAPAATSDRGLSYVDPVLLQRVARTVARQGFQLHVHAIGDRAVREALDAIAAAVGDPASTPDLRHHIAHLQVVDPRDVHRFAAIGATANLQALWACHEPAMDELNIPLLGPERTAWQYPFGALARAGAPLAMGSDWPVSSPDPLAAIEVSVTRRAAGSDLPPLLPEQALDVRTALSAYTRGSARVNSSKDAGQVAVGALGDLVVLDRDVTAVPSEEISGVRVDLTLVSGAPVFAR
jgi:predicted amidohydrolase YtcJ